MKNVCIEEAKNDWFDNVDWNVSLDRTVFTPKEADMWPTMKGRIKFFNKQCRAMSKVVKWTMNGK